MNKWRPARGYGHGKVLVMITEWERYNYETDTYDVFYDAEIYPNNGRIIAESASLSRLLKSLTSKTAQNEIKKVNHDSERTRSVY